ncbi:MAG: VOC family protein [Roseiarcus sp.]|jgi:predicted enzyme related to lactoylglutathione lyase
MNLVSVRIIAADVRRMARFYERISRLPATIYGDDFAELATPSCTLAIGSARTMAELARPADNHTAIIEFRVADVDAEFETLRGMLGPAIVQPPTTMPWGNRSLLFRDPDGNLVNLFAPVTTEAIRKFDQ